MSVNTNILDFYNIFVNEIVGSPVLFIVIAISLSAIILVKMKAPTQVFIISLAAVGFIFSIRFNQPLLSLTILFVFGFIGYTFSRLRRE